MESILTSIKKLLGITEEYTHFDTDLIIHINSVFSILRQIGVGPKDGFSIKGSEEVWTDFISEPNAATINFVKTYVYLKVRLIFDPPASSTIAESYKREAAEIEWRLNSEIDYPINKEVIE